MDIKVTLRLTARGREATALGFERIDIIDFGYDQRGVLSSVVCIADCMEPDGSTHGHPSTGGHFDIFTIGGYIDIFEDLFHNYEVDKGNSGGP